MVHGFFKRDNLNQIKSAFEMKEIQSGKIRVNIEHPTIKIRRVLVPKVPKEELAEVVKWSLKEVLTENIEGYIYRYQPLPEKTEEGKEAHLVYVIERKVLDEYQSLLSEINVPRPEIIEPSASALVLNFLHNHTISQEERVVLINLGACCSHFLVVGSSGLLFSRPFGSISGEILTKQISRNLGLPEEEAEKIKIGDPQAKIPPEKQSLFNNTITNFFSKAVIEVQRSLDVYSTQASQLNVKKIYFTGGGVHLEGFISYIAETLKMETEAFDPFRRISLGRFQDDEGFLNKKHYYSMACGLAL